MGFFKSKEERIAIKEAKREAQRKADEEAKAAQQRAMEEARMARLKPYVPYHEWLNEQANNFVAALAEQGFHATWGFEQQKNIDFNKGLMCESGPAGVMVFNVPQMFGLVFDDASETCVYYSCPESKYDTYLQTQQPFYKYQKFSYKDLLNVKVEVNDAVSYQSTTTSSNVAGRAMVGGIIAGSVGAAVAGATAPQNTTTQSHSVLKKVTFFLQTTHPDCRTIQFSFHRSYLQSERTAIADEAIGNAMMSTFSAMPYKMEVVACQRKNGSTHDCRIERNEGSFRHRDDNDWWRMTEDMWRGHTEDARDRLLDFARRIDAIILANKANTNAVVASQKSLPSVEDKLIKLKDLFECGLITLDEYNEKKKEILKDF